MHQATRNNNFSLSFIEFTSNDYENVLTTPSLIKWVKGALSEGVVRPRREDGRSSPSSWENTNSCKYTFTLPRASLARTVTISP
jgi:hypothetical protein